MQGLPVKQYIYQKPIDFTYMLQNTKQALNYLRGLSEMDILSVGILLWSGNFYLVFSDK